MKAVKFVILASVALAASAVWARTEPNSFLNRPANTRDALLKQVRTDAQVLSRYQRHFGWTKQEVINYISGLHIGRLPQDAVYLVYNVNNNEEIHARVMYYKKGTPVWVNSNGEPQMKVSCANPMVRGTDDQNAIIQTDEELAQSIREVEAPAMGEGEAVAEATSEVMEVETQTEAQVTATDVLPAAVVSDVPILESVGRGSSFNPLFLAPLAGLAFIRHGDGGDDNTPPPVPEPATMVIVGGGAAALLAAKKRAKKS